MVVAITVFKAGSVLPQQRPAHPTEPTLAIQVVDVETNRPPTPVYWSRSQGMLEIGVTKKLPNWTETAGAPLTRIRIRSNMEGDASARINVAAVFDDSEPVETPGPKYGQSEKHLNSYLVREGETITVDELAKFGFEPLILKIVKAQPHQEEPAIDAPPPPVINNLKSVEIVGIAPDSISGRNYQLTVRNVSTKNILALEVYQARKGSRTATISNGDPLHPIMKPADLHTCSLPYPRRRELSKDGQIEEESNLVVGTVVFDDETFEGEPATALRIVSGLDGQRIQFGRAVLLLKKILESPFEDPEATLTRLNEDVSRMRIDVDSQTVDELLRRFPNLPREYDRRMVTRVVMDGLKNGRTHVLRRVQDIQRAKARPSSDAGVWTSLEELRQELETYLRKSEEIAPARR